MTSSSSEAALRAALDEARDALLVVDPNGTIVEANRAATAILGPVVGTPLASLGDRLDHASQTPVPGGLVVTLSGAPGPAVHEQELERFPVGAVLLDAGLHVVSANARARQLLGRGTLEVGAPFGRDGAAVLLPLAQSLVATRAPRRATLAVADGQTLRAMGIPATAEDHALLLFEDVSREVEHERVMREFLRNAAHQLRTPLTGITAAVDTLQSGAKERPADRDLFLGHVAAHTERLVRIAHGLLLLARAETGETLAVDVVALSPLLARIVAEARPRAGVAIRSTCPEELAAIATPDLLHEALAALVDNAVAHTAAGEITVGAAADDGTVVISVADQGPGIPAEFHERIFEPFFRVGVGGEGYGLGLAIAAQAVRAMHGEIGVSSAPGEGTTFTVALPSAAGRP